MDNPEPPSPTFPVPPAGASAYGAWEPEAPPSTGGPGRPKRARSLIAAGISAAVIAAGGFLAVRAVPRSSGPS